MADRPQVSEQVAHGRVGIDGALVVQVGRLISLSGLFLVDYEVAVPVQDVAVLARLVAEVS
ncbi:hypothetical protein [Promicromonospora sp. NPDC050249]|uniref:hypothetical protein n=1 Tax=Promicromonospora sp. NPDC050249 TaxID=3154743 RepID=UPI0033C5CED0